MNLILKNKILSSIIVILVFLFGSGVYYTYLVKNEFNRSRINIYNESFGNVVNYMNSVESLLAKSLISKDSKNSAETLTEVWRDSNLALVYLNKIPINSDKLSQTAKFLNQVSDFSYSLSRKNIKNEELSENDLENLKLLHEYSMQLEQTLNSLSEELYTGVIKWEDFKEETNLEYAQAVDNISVFSSIDSNLDEYEGLIYDGAYSDHVNKKEKVGLTGDNISEDEAYQKVKDFFGEEKIENINLNNLLENADIASYDFSVKLLEQDSDINIAVTQKGGFIIEMQNNRDVYEEKISQNEANMIGTIFLQEKGFEGMVATYFTKLENIVTINYAYKNNGIIAYPDLIKLKIALDNGEILGIETEGYLNSHTSREFSEVSISIDEAREKINSDLEILSEGLAIIPTEWKTELLCYEFKGKVNDREFLVYINTETGDEEDILVILDTPGGTLTI